MNKKPIDSTAIENELKGASQFFPTSEKVASRTAPNDDNVGKKVEEYKPETQSPQQRPPLHGTTEEKQTPKETKVKNSQPPEDADSTTPSNHDTMVSRYHDTTVSRHHEPMTPSMIESIRRVVKLVGKEAATHRFTPEEKQTIADIIYMYRRQGYDTSENEIARIAINWLAWDHQEHGQESVLAHVLKALKE